MGKLIFPFYVNVCVWVWLCVAVCLRVFVHVHHIHASDKGMIYVYVYPCMCHQIQQYGSILVWHTYDIGVTPVRCVNITKTYFLYFQPMMRNEDDNLQHMLRILIQRGLLPELCEVDHYRSHHGYHNVGNKHFKQSKLQWSKSIHYPYHVYICVCLFVYTCVCVCLCIICMVLKKGWYVYMCFNSYPIKHSNLALP